jgi:hypothetical protein
MSTRFLVGSALTVAVAGGWLAIALSAQQPPSNAAGASGASAVSGGAMRTPWGDPDLQGIWTTDDEVRVPVERPKEFGTRTMLTDKEMADRLKEAERRAKDDKGERQKLAEDQTGDGPEHWYEQGRAISHRTSLIIDPPDGRLPPMTPEGQKRLEDQRSRGSFAKRLWAGPEELDLRDRCITRGVPNTWFPSAYNNGFQIVQSPGYVAILHERLHEARIIPVDNRPHVPSSVSQWIGDPRGHWEGQTLVVEITNFSDKSEFRGAGGNLKVVERYTRVDPDTVKVEFTVNDPSTWTKPWTAMLMGKRDPNYWQIFEYACHEGNYGMFNMLSGARAQERANEEAAKKQQSTRK